MKLSPTSTATIASILAFATLPALVGCEQASSDSSGQGSKTTNVSVSKRVADGLALSELFAAGDAAALRKNVWFEGTLAFKDSKTVTGMATYNYSDTISQELHEHQLEWREGPKKIQWKLMLDEKYTDGRYLVTGKYIGRNPQGLPQFDSFKFELLGPLQ